MGAVEFEPVDPDAQRALGRLHEPVADALQPLRVEGMGRHLALAMGNSRGRLGAPAVRHLRLDLRAAVPGGAARGLATGMVDLDRDGDRRTEPHRIEHPAQRQLGLVRVEAEIGGRDPRLRRDRGGLQRQQARARHGELPQMHQVPIAGLARMGRILAHGGDDDAVGQRQAVEGQRFEQACGHARDPVLADSLDGAPVSPAPGMDGPHLRFPNVPKLLRLRYSHISRATAYWIHRSFFSRQSAIAYDSTPSFRVATGEPGYPEWPRQWRAIQSLRQPVESCPTCVSGSRAHATRTPG